MGRPSALPSRNVEILHAIVQAYIETGEPVASRTISRQYHNALSPASIRNIMADLCDEGFLAQPHTSAGRVPTEKAFRSYVQSLDGSRLLAGELSRLRRDLSRLGTMEARVERSSHMLVEMTDSLSIAAAIPSSSQLLSHVELLALPDNRVLMVVVTQDHVIHNRAVSVEHPISSEELTSIRNYLNHHFSGWPLHRVREELQRRFEEVSAAYDEILKTLTMLYDKGLLDIGVHPAVHMEGASNLLGLDLHLTREKMRELFQTLEQKKRILYLLDRFLEQSSREVTVHVGLGEAHPSMEELSLIGITVTLPSGVCAKVAVLGPMRMHYERVMSAVLHVGQALQSIPV